MESTGWVMWNMGTWLMTHEWIAKLSGSVSADTDPLLPGGIASLWFRRHRCVSWRFCWATRRGDEAVDDFSPPARWGLLDFMSVAASSCLPPPPPAFRLLLPSASCRLLPRPPPPRPPRPPRRPRRPRPTAIRDPQCSLPDLNHDHPRPVFPAGPQPRPSPPSVPCRTSTTTIPAQCSLPDLNHDHPRPVFPAGPQPRVSTPSVPCRTST